MCSASVVYRYGQDIPYNDWTPKTLESYTSLLDAAKSFDEASKQPHCHDPVKERWYQELVERMKKFEQQLSEQSHA